MSTRVNAQVAGTLLMVATVASVVGGPALADPIVKGPAYLARASVAQDRVFAGVFVLGIAAFSCAGIAISLYPVLRR